MKILFYSSNSPYSHIRLYKGRSGGAEINLRLIAEELTKLDHQTYYYSTKKGYSVRKEINGVYTFHSPNIHIPTFNKELPIIKNFNEKIMIFQQIKRLENILINYNIDLIHTYSTYPDTYISICAAKKHNIPIVQRIAGRAWYNLLTEKPSLKEKIEWTFNNVDLLLFISDFIKDKTFNYFLELDFKVNRPWNVNDIGINFDYLQNINLEQVKAKYNLSDSEKIILCVESFKKYSKRQDIIIKALPILLEKMKNLKVIFVGKGSTLRQMKYLADKIGVLRNINFLGEIPHKDVLEIMSIAEIVVHPTDFEGYSTVLRETFALGKPLLVSDIKPMNEVIKDGVNGMLAENSSIKFAEKIIFLLSNNEIRKTIGENAYEYAKEKFDSKKNILAYEKMFLGIHNKH